MNLKIEKLSRTPRVSKRTGKPFNSLSILSGGKWYSAIESQWNASWGEGQTVEANVEEKPGDNGKVFYNLVNPNGGSRGNGPSTNDMDEIKSMFAQVMKELLEVKALVQPKKESFTTTTINVVGPKAIQADPDDNGPVPNDSEMPF